MGLISSKGVSGTPTSGNKRVENIHASVYSTEPEYNGPTPEVCRRQLALMCDPRSPTHEIVRTPIQVEKTPQRDAPKLKSQEHFGFPTSSEVTKELDLATGIDKSIEAEDEALSEEIIAEDKPTEFAQRESDVSEAENLCRNLQQLNICQQTRGDKQISKVAATRVKEANFTSAVLKKRLLIKSMPLNEVNRSPLMQLNGCTPRKTLKFRAEDSNRLSKENVWHD